MNTYDRSVFERSCLVYGMRPDYIEALVPMGTEVLFRGSEEIIRHHATDADLYVILEGYVNCLTHDGDKLYEAGPGSVIGEIAFLDGGARSATAIAVNHVTALKFSAPELRRKMCAEKDLGFAILANLSRLVCARLRNADDRLDALMDTAHEAWNTADR